MIDRIIRRHAFDDPRELQHLAIEGVTVDWLLCSSLSGDSRGLPGGTGVGVFFKNSTETSVPSGKETPGGSTIFPFCTVPIMVMAVDLRSRNQVRMTNSSLSALF